MFQNKKLTWLFILLAVATTATMPGAISFLPDSIEETVKGLCGFITLVAALLGFKTNPNPPADLPSKDQGKE